MKKVYILSLLCILSFSISAQLLLTEEPAVLTTGTGDIYGTLKVPVNNKPIPVALIIVGSGPTDRNGNQPQMKNNSLKMLSDALFYNNIATLCFDKRGIAESKAAGKNEADLRFDDYVDDVRSWIDYLAKDKRFSEIVIIGHSEGSLIGMIAAQNDKRASKYISIAGIGEPAANVLKEQLEKQMATQPQIAKDMVFSYIDKLEKGETIAEVFDREDVLLSSDTLYISFKNSNTGEQLIAALHFSTTLDKNNDRGFLIEILKKCASWYCDYCDWRDAEGF
jgi:alpha/beta superfamily hydrolase